jgi:hypothetical protein
MATHADQQPQVDELQVPAAVFEQAPQGVKHTASFCGALFKVGLVVAVQV